MRKLLLQLLALLGSVGLAVGLLLGPVIRRPYLDEFYARFTRPPAASLVLGTSRAAQGIVPAELQAQLGGRFEGPWLNYAFTLFQSPYGPAYLAGVRRKLAPDGRRGLFVLAVDPWALSQSRYPLPGWPAGAWPEDPLMLGNLHCVSCQPNLEYVARFYDGPLYRMLLPDPARHTGRLHPDGWYESLAPASITSPQREAARLQTYRGLATERRPSAARLASLRQLIGLLKGHGRVVLVRLPVGLGMRTLEATYQPGFDQLMRQLADSLAVPYFNYVARPYPTTDGSHLERTGARAVSRELAQDIARLPPP